MWQAWRLVFKFGGPWDDHGGLGSTRKDIWGQASVLVDLGCISGSHFESFTDTLDQKIFVRARFQVAFSLMIFGSESGCRGSQNKHLAEWYCKKTTFAEVRLLRVDF